MLSSMNCSFSFYLRPTLYTNKHYETQQFCLNELRHEQASIALYDDDDYDDNNNNYYYYY